MLEALTIEECLSLVMLLLCTGTAQSSVESGDITSTVLALRTLGNFDFEGHSLTQFVRHCADNFLSSEHKEIRIEAARTCSSLLQPAVNVSLGLVSFSLKFGSRVSTVVSL